MRTANDGRGDEPWEEPVTAPSSDDESTRVFSRDDFTAVPAPPAEAAGDGVGGADGEATREFTRAGPAASGDPATREFARPGPSDPGGAPDDGGTRAFDRPDPASDDLHGAPAEDAPAGAAFTRRFVRDRPRPRGPGRSAPAAEPSVEGPDGPFDEEPPLPPRGGRPARPAARPRRRKRRPVRLRWIVTLLLLVALAIPPGTWGWVWHTARQDDRVASDAIVVLGASQYNGVPSPVFEARLRHAQVLYLEGVAPVIVTVGGKQPGDNFTEAAAGKNWLVEVGIPADQIIAVEEGRDTLQSIGAVSLVFEDRAWETAVLVSDPWHSLRSKRMAADFGIEAGTSPSRSGPAVIERRTQLWYITRETASLWYYWIFNDSSDIRVNAA
ncbi:YdcF family protein [Streptomonospora nanhaiensis]|uniref:YdcF family protein n=1 Tax=Streptomonospora nanhaiensis TaxID=1323731 RepID=A0ABY6YIP2_9ACTN|nr:ElyC/SanA/YdcF family protein [Streptomonospora nanhaiensis]WAE72147.1 YdcF family protein [Streptomonospora nanhaiensis]